MPSNDGTALFRRILRAVNSAGNERQRLQSVKPHRQLPLVRFIMLTRREFCLALGLGAAQAPALLKAQPAGPRKRLAIICTHWTMQSHAQHMGDRFLTGYPIRGTWHYPPFDVASLYVDQKPEGDQSAARAQEFGFTIYPTIAEALCRGGKSLAV